jgi:hypothetical protein
MAVYGASRNATLSIDWIFLTLQPNTSLQRCAAATAMLAVLAVGCADGDRDARDADTGATHAKLDVPTSVRYDAERDIYYVANVASDSSIRWNAGYIARVGDDSALVLTKLVEGGRNGATLHAPRGMALRGDTLIVADGDTARRFNRHNGASLGAAPLDSQDAAFLDEIRSAPDGIYLPEMGVVRSAGSDVARAPATSSLAGMMLAADAAMSGPQSAVARRHMRLTPARTATLADSARAVAFADSLRVMLRQYADTAAATAAGYRMMMSNLTGQRVLHFTNYRNALAEVFRFDGSRPTSLLYQRMPDRSLKLIGAMFTAPRRIRMELLDTRLPLSLARWHRHVDWCLPNDRDSRRLTEVRNGLPLFGPDSPIATRRECESVGGVFHEAIFGWMVHANVFLGNDLLTVFGGHH